jgi:hypothetical protein
MRALFDRDADGSLKDSVKFMLIQLMVGVPFWRLSEALVRSIFVFWWSFGREQDKFSLPIIFWMQLNRSWRATIYQFSFYWILCLILIFFVKKKYLFIPILSACGLLMCLIYVWASFNAKGEFSLEAVTNIESDFLSMLTAQTMASALTVWFVSIYMDTRLKARKA